MQLEGRIASVSGAGIDKTIALLLAHEGAQLALFLASDAASHISRTALGIDGFESPLES